MIGEHEYVFDIMIYPEHYDSDDYVPGDVFIAMLHQFMYTYLLDDYPYNNHLKSLPNECDISSPLTDCSFPYVDVSVLEDDPSVKIKLVLRLDDNTVRKMKDKSKQRLQVDTIDHVSLDDKVFQTYGGDCMDYIESVIQSLRLIRFNTDFKD